VTAAREARDLGHALIVELPADPPVLTPAAARALLRLLMSIHSQVRITCEDELPLGRTA
jgi:hypothetical protein